MYNLIKNYLHSWFPLLPTYQAFNSRLNNLCEAFPILKVDFFNTSSISDDQIKVLIGDSFPVITCSHKREGKVVRDLTDKGYCATKKLHYYGIKIHTIGLRRTSTMSFPQYIEVTAASVHDLTASRDILEKIQANVTILDKAYCDTDLAKKMEQNNNTLLAPSKDKRACVLV